MIHRFNRTKIVATIGPASMDKRILEKMIRAGMDVCRINSSHGNYEATEQIIRNVRALNNELHTHVAILFDLQGPKLRIGDLEKEFELKEGTTLRLTTVECLGTPAKIFIKYPQFAKDVSVGESVLINDGNIELRVSKKISDQEVDAVVLHGGMLSARKGVNLPHTKISLPSLTEKDLLDLEFILKHDVEWIGLSFVRQPQDVIALKNILRTRESKARVVAKIEKPEAVANIDRIIAESDAVMVARGDLGVEMPMEQIPVIQKKIVFKCNAASKPVIIATQMMESMITNFRPTRAEANDVGNAVFDGSDALMLSAETSVGKFPIETVNAMQKIITEVEALDEIYYHELAPKRDASNFISDSICYTACTLARQAKATAIAAMTHSGSTAFKIAAHRPKADIYIFTDNKPLLCTLNLVWGVRGFYYDKYESTDLTFNDIKNHLVRHNLIASGEMMIHIASTPLNKKSTANTIKLALIE